MPKTILILNSICALSINQALSNDLFDFHLTTSSCMKLCNLSTELLHRFQ
jgi:hypothetical protein